MFSRSLKGAEILRDRELNGRRDKNMDRTQKKCSESLKMNYGVIILLQAPANYRSGETSNFRRSRFAPDVLGMYVHRMSKKQVRSKGKYVCRIGDAELEMHTSICAAPSMDLLRAHARGELRVHALRVRVLFHLDMRIRRIVLLPATTLETQ